MKTLFAAVLILLGIAACGASTNTSIHRMVIGDKVLELQDTLHLTLRRDGLVRSVSISPDGKYVVYAVYTDDPGELRLCMMRSTGGNPSVLIAPPSSGKSSDSRTPKDIWVLDRSAGGNPIAWSPDSRLMAIPVRHITTDSQGNPEDLGPSIQVLTTAKFRRALLPLPKGSWLRGKIKWSPDARRIACVVASTRSEGEQRSRDIIEVMVFDLVRGSSMSVFARDGSSMDVDLDSWSQDGKTLRYTVSDRNHPWPTELRESQLDGSPDKLDAEYIYLIHKSPDGRYKLANKWQSLVIEDCKTGRTTEIMKAFFGEVLGWTPDSKILTYQQSLPVKDASLTRSKKLNMIWLAVPETHRLNSMCAALDADPDREPCFSRDCLKMAYTSNGRVCLAQFTWADLDVPDKIAAGLPLTEDEEKEYLMNSAKQIGVAVAMYTADWDGKLPSSDAFVTDLMPYIRAGESLFFRPGTENMAFQYFSLGDNISAITNPSQAVMGMFDVGYAWKILLFADGHVEVRPK